MTSSTNSDASAPLSHNSPMNSSSPPSAGSSPTAHPPTYSTHSSTTYNARNHHHHHHHECAAKPTFHNAVYYTYDGRPPSVALSPEVISIIYYPSALVHPDGLVQLADPKVDSEILIDGTTGCLRALTNLKRRNPSLKVILSLTGREAFRSAAATEESRQKLASSARALVDLHGLDGIDVDWQYPTEQDEGDHYVQLLRACRETLHQGQYWLTTTMPPTPTTYVFGRDGVRLAAGYVDLVNLVCYDFHYRGTSRSLSQLYSPARTFYNNFRELSCHSAMTGLVNMEVPREKIVLGVPVFGRAISANANGLEHQRIPYKDLNWESADVDSELGTATSRFGEMSVVSHDNPLSVSMKADFIRENRLAGMFFMNANMDTPTAGGSLINAGYCSLNTD